MIDEAPTCLMGKSSVRECPACGYVHGRLAPDPCDTCKSDTWTVAVRDSKHNRTCAECLK